MDLRSDAVRGAWAIAQRIVAGSRWRHLKTDREHVVISGAVREEDLTALVVYRPVGGETVWVRPLAQFLDGRFERIS